MKFQVGQKAEVKDQVDEGTTKVKGLTGVILSVDTRMEDGVRAYKKIYKIRFPGFSDGHGEGRSCWWVREEFLQEPKTKEQIKKEETAHGSLSKATTANPKDLLGNKKVSITKFPLVALIHGSHGMVNGAEKYGPYNWREKDVIASIYVDAAMRHLIAWFEREEIAEDSGVHHLGHALASIGILLDAQENGNLIDDRPSAKRKEVVKNLLDRLSAVIVEQREKKIAAK